MEASYEAAGVTRFAAWVHDSDAAVRSDLERQGYTIDETTRAMGITLDDVRLPPPQVELGPADWSEHLRPCGLPSGFLGGIPRRFRFWWHGLAPRMSRPRSRCITPVTAGSTTSGHSSMRANADWRPG